MKIQWLKVKCFITASIISLSFGAVAGQVSNVNVSIDKLERVAKGNMADARFSDNKHEMIGCGKSAWVHADGSYNEQGFCQASVAKGENVICFTENPVLLNKINAVSDYSYLSFRWNKGGDCEFIHVSTQSFYIP